MKRYSEKRPWGGFEQFCENEPCTVKLIDVAPGAELSLQYHEHRDEFWMVLYGEPVIVVGEKSSKAREGDEFFIPRRTKHRAAAGGAAARLLEISFGKFDEDDVVRLKDRYGRS